MGKNELLILDDEAAICTALSYALKEEYNVKTAGTAAEAYALMEEIPFDLCLLDLNLGPDSGLDVLRTIKQNDSRMVVIIMTAYGSINSTVEAVKLGAYSYLTKPLDMYSLKMVLEQGLEHRRLNERVEYLSRELENKYVYNGIIGRSSSMQRVFEMIERLKNVDTNVVISGESGTGKELVARALHFSGKRRDARLAVINCAAIPEHLLEEQLFGHKKGSFTGAVNDSQGMFQYADGGSIFFDEIGEIPFSLQAKLLRVLQEKKYLPIGSNKPVEVNVRIIAATNRDLKEMVREKQFREDLYFRLNVVEIHLPPLRERKQDLPLLFQFFIAKYAQEIGRPVTGLTRQAERRLLDYSYPGNVRELSNMIEYAIVMSDGDLIDAGCLPETLQPPNRAAVSSAALDLRNLEGLTMEEVEKRVIEAGLSRNGGHVGRTAEMLQLSDKGLRNKIAKYKINI